MENFRKNYTGIVIVADFRGLRTRACHIMRASITVEITIMNDNQIIMTNIVLEFYDFRRILKKVTEMMT